MLAIIFESCLLSGEMAATSDTGKEEEISHEVAASGEPGTPPPQMHIERRISHVGRKQSPYAPHV
jgi:hypothetical protein